MSAARERTYVVGSAHVLGNKTILKKKKKNHDDAVLRALRSPNCTPFCYANFQVMFLRTKRVCAALMRKLADRLYSDCSVCRPRVPSFLPSFLRFKNRACRARRGSSDAGGRRRPRNRSWRSCAAGRLGISRRDLRGQSGGRCGSCVRVRGLQ